MSGDERVNKVEIDGIEWTFVVKDGFAVVGDGSSTAIPQTTSGKIAIPLALGGCPVTKIGDGAFRFCEKLTDKLVVIDTKDYDLPGIDDEFRVICSPMILTSLVTDRLAAHYELNTGHSLEFRRYYRQFDY